MYNVHVVSRYVNTGVKLSYRHMYKQTNEHLYFFLDIDPFVNVVVVSIHHICDILLLFMTKGVYSFFGTYINGTYIYHVLTYVSSNYSIIYM